MKRGLEEEEEEDVFSAWYAEMTGPRRGELGYLLLCEWRAVYAVDARVPYVNTRVAWMQHGFVMTDDDDDDGTKECYAIASAGAGTVTFYHPEELSNEYTGWRNREYWAPRALPVVVLEALPVELWLHWSRLLSPYEYVSMASAPLCRAWRALWKSDARGWMRYNTDMIGLHTPITREHEKTRLATIRLKAYIEHCTNKSFNTSDANVLSDYILGETNKRALQFGLNVFGTFGTLTVVVRKGNCSVHFRSKKGMLSTITYDNSVVNGHVIHSICWWTAATAEEMFNAVLGHANTKSR